MKISQIVSSLGEYVTIASVYLTGSTTNDCKVSSTELPQWKVANVDLAALAASLGESAALPIEMFVTISVSKPILYSSVGCFSCGIVRCVQFFYFPILRGIQGFRREIKGLEENGFSDYT